MVLNQSVRHVENLPSGPLQSVAPVDVFTKQEQLVIQESNGIGGTAANHEAGSKNPVYLPSGAVVPIRKCVVTGNAAVGKKSSQWRTAKQDGTECREMPAARLQATVRIEEFWAAGSYLGALITKGHEFSQSVVQKDCIRIQQEEIATLRDSVDSVVVRSKPKRVGIAPNLHFRERVPNKLLQAFFRSIQDEIDFKVDGRGVLIQGFQTGTDVLLVTMADDADGNVAHVLPASFTRRTIR